MSTENSQNNGTGTGVNLLALPTGVELGKYRILHTLGQGGFGITYLAELITDGGHVVIKENLPSFCALRDRTTLQVAATNPNDELQEYEQFLRRFVDEAKLLAQLNHPHIVKVLGAFEALGTAYYVMPWVGGKELQKAAPASGVITESWLQPILRTMLSTLEYLHTRNIYHRDVKPANILLTEDGSPILIDFGTARAIISDRSATHVGSPGYSPIEQLRSKGKRGPWTDVYSLGATCYRLITGERPPEAFDRIDEDEDPLRPLAPRVELHKRFSPTFLATIDKALSRRGKDRWQTATEWLTALPAPAPQPTPHPTPTSVAPEQSPRPRRIPAFILLTLILALGIPGGYMLSQHTQEIGTQSPNAQQEAEQKAQEEAERKAQEEAERKAKEEAERKAEEQARLTENFTGLLLQMHAALSNAQLEIAPAAARVAGGEQLSEQSALLQHFNTLRQTAADAKSLTDKLSAEDISRLCDTLPNEPQSFRSFIIHFCDAPTNTADSFSDEKLLALLGWDAALAGAQKEAKRKSIREAQRILGEKGISVEEYNSKLLSAVYDGDSELSALLITAGADVNTTDSNAWTPLTNAARKGNTKCIKLLLATPGIDINKADTNGDSPLYHAVFCNQSECIKLLLATPGIDTSHWTPLSLAIIENNVAKLRQLLATPGIDVNAPFRYEMTPLYLAVRMGHVECVKLLLEMPGIDVNKADALKEAAVRGHDECMKLLLEMPGINVNQASSFDRTPLYYAAWNGHYECLRLLLAAPGIDVNKVDAQGDTPITRAASNGHHECVKLLLTTPGIKVNKVVEDGNSPLFWAANHGHTECVKLLLAAPGIKVNEESPLVAAAKNGHDECVKLLLAAPRIDVNTEDYGGDTPLYSAAENGNTECVRLLLAAPGIKVNKVTDYYGSTPLQRAAYKGHSECVKLLLAVRGININRANNYGHTALSEAASYGRTECVKLLLAAPGIDVNKATPLYWAAAQRHIECVKLLLAAPKINVNKVGYGNKTPLKAAEKEHKSECARLIREAGGR